MKRTILLSLAGLTLVAGCTDTLTRPADVSSGRLAPRGPLLDDIANDLDGTLDAVAEAMPLTVGGASGTTELYVQPAGGDGKPGCNLTGSTTLVVSVASSDPSVATVSPSSVTFTSCGDTKTLSISPVSAGSAQIGLSQSSNSTGGTFNLAPASFTVTVTPPPNTAPTIAVAGVTGGAAYNKGAVPEATCQVTDAEDGDDSFPATLSLVIGTYASDGIGNQTASCTYTDAGGLTVTASETYSIVDPTAPTISYTLDPTSPDGSNGWYKSDIALDWTVTETESPNSLNETGCADQVITTDQSATTYTCSATSAGGSAPEQSVAIKRDATAPTYVLTRLPAANASEWNKTAVEVKYGWADATSGLDACSADVTLSTEGAGQSASGNCVDKAGNATSVPVTGINIDLTLPTVSLVGGPENGVSYFFGSVPAQPTCSASDALSGLANPCQVTGYGNTVGTHTVSATATDKAGNTKTDARTYTVKAWTLHGFYQPVDMNGVVNTVKNGSTVPLKFNVFAATELTDPSVVKQPLVGVIEVSCNASSATDDIELVTTGATVLRYDVTARQFILNWQTPKKVGACYKVTMTTQDGSALSALFKLK